MTPKKTAALMAKHGVISPAAVEDPEGYDNGQTLANVAAFVAEAGNSLEAMERERDAAVAELAALKAAVGWTMGKLLISDLLGSGAETGPTAAEGWLPGLYGAPEVAADCLRLDWINTHGRVGALNNGRVFLTIPPPRLDGEVPEVFNIRHILDLCRQNHA